MTDLFSERLPDETEPEAEPGETLEQPAAPDTDVEAGNGESGGADAEPSVEVAPESAPSA